MNRYSNYARILATAAPAPLATVNVYLAGTLTSATIYSDNLATPTPLANPFTADANGFVYFYAADGRYDVRLSGGGIVTAYTWGDIVLGIPELGWFNVQDYGAIGDDATDDSAAIQAAIDDASANDRRSVVYFPPTVTNQYRAVGLQLTNRPVKLMGSANRGTGIKLLTNTDHLIKAENASEFTGITFQDLTFHALDSTTYDCFYATRIALASFIRCTFSHCRNGIFFDTDARMSSVIDCIFGSSCVTGLRLGSGANYHAVMGCWFDENTTRGLYVNGFGNTIVGNRFADNVGQDIYIDAAGLRNTIVGNAFESGSTAVTIECYGDNNIISGNSGATHSGNEIIFGAGGDNNIVGPNNFVTWTIADSGSGNRVIGMYNASNNVRIDSGTQLTVGAAGAASALPAQPTGYMVIDISGTQRVVPFYAIS